MEVKEAIELIKYHITDFKERTSDDELVDRDKCNKFLEKANGIITLLQRGEAYEKIVEYMKNEQYDVWVSLPGYFTGLKEFIRPLEQKYLKEAKDDYPITEE